LREPNRCCDCDISDGFDLLPVGHAERPLAGFCFFRGLGWRLWAFRKDEFQGPVELRFLAAVGERREGDLGFLGGLQGLGGVPLGCAGVEPGGFVSRAGKGAGEGGAGAGHFEIEHEEVLVVGSGGVGPADEVSLGSRAVRLEKLVMRDEVLVLAAFGQDEAG